MALARTIAAGVVQDIRDLMKARTAGLAASPAGDALKIDFTGVLIG
ncbi:hypothetical protein [Rhizobium jaguaris]|nr:hypothetical protein [Rhizobium jaguaris]